MSLAQRSSPATIGSLLIAGLLAACQAVATPSPSPSVAPTPTPTPAPPTGDAVIEAFLRRIGDPALPMHVVLTGTVTVHVPGSQETVTIDFDGDIRGQDAHGEFRVDTGPSDVSFEMLILDGSAYLLDNRSWTPLPDYEQTTPLNPFANLSAPDQLLYRGSQLRSGQRAHHLKSQAWLGSDPDSLIAQGWTDPTIDDHLTEIWTTDDGTPLELSIDASLSGTFEGQSAVTKFLIDYLFTNVGEPVVLPSPT